LQKKSIVTDADGAFSTKCATPMGTAVDTRAWISLGDAVVAFQIVAFVTCTQSFIGAGNYTKTIGTTVNTRTWTSGGHAITTLKVESLVADTQRRIGGGHHTRAVSPAGDPNTGRARNIVFYAFGSVRMIAGAAVADGGFTLDNSADAIAFAFDPLARVVNGGFLADAISYCKSNVADTDWAFTTDGTSAMGTTVDANTVILELVATATTGYEKQCQQRQSSFKHESPPSSWQSVLTPTLYKQRSKNRPWSRLVPPKKSVKKKLLRNDLGLGGRGWDRDRRQGQGRGQGAGGQGQGQGSYSCSGVGFWSFTNSLSKTVA
jgi:hypothetical protein